MLYKYEIIPQRPFSLKRTAARLARYPDLDHPTISTGSLYLLGRGWYLSAPIPVPGGALSQPDALRFSHLL